MREPNRLIRVVALAALSLWRPPDASAQSLKILWSFQGGTDGEYPVTTLLADGKGDLFGTTKSGGTSASCGTVFELAPDQNFFAKWTSWTFQSTSSTDGCNPYAHLILDSAGNLYGTTNAGGTYGYGVAFELIPAGQFTFTEKILWNFGNGQDGRNPAAGMVMDGEGNLYGTTSGGGKTGCKGTVFELAPVAGGGWTETVLHSFGCTAGDGSTPVARVTLDHEGNIFGTTELGGTGLRCGASGCGTVFELHKAAGWPETVLHSFTGRNGGGLPLSPVIVKPNNILGLASAYPQQGVAFLLHNNGVTWQEKVLYSFPSQPGDGEEPIGALIGTGKHYFGTTLLGGGGCKCGSIYELTKTRKGWQETILYTFIGSGIGDGANPIGGLVKNTDGNFYGTTEFGGTSADCFNGCGTIYQLQP